MSATNYCAGSEAVSDRAALDEQLAALIARALVAELRREDAEPDDDPQPADPDDPHVVTP